MHYLPFIYRIISAYPPNTISPVTAVNGKICGKWPVLVYYFGLSYTPPISNGEINTDFAYCSIRDSLQFGSPVSILVSYGEQAKVKSRTLL